MGSHSVVVFVGYWGLRFANPDLIDNEVYPDYDINWATNHWIHTIIFIPILIEPFLTPLPLKEMSMKNLAIYSITFEVGYRCL
jgi:hypothetical protein